MNSLPLNPFMSVRPRGVDMPSAPAPRKTTNTSSNSAFGDVRKLYQEGKALDARGRQTVSLAPRELRQPPHFGLVGAAQTVDSKQFDAALQQAKEAHIDSQTERRKRATDRSIFDRSTKGSR